MQHVANLGLQSTIIEKHLKQNQAFTSVKYACWMGSRIPLSNDVPCRVGTTSKLQFQKTIPTRLFGWSVKKWKKTRFHFSLYFWKARMSKHSELRSAIMAGVRCTRPYLHTAQYVCFAAHSRTIAVNQHQPLTPSDESNLKSQNSSYLIRKIWLGQSHLGSLFFFQRSCKSGHSEGMQSSSTGHCKKKHIQNCMFLSSFAWS